jgi:hydroxyethylthiazole kinase-like uncharacterized protein yjeF
LGAGNFPVISPGAWNKGMQSEPDIQSTSTRVYSTAELREIDRIAIAESSDSGFGLMCLAGAGACKAMMTNWPGVEAVRVFCGTGNNGGDGLVLAGLAAKAGLQAQAILCGEQKRIMGNARQALEFALARQVEVLSVADLDSLSLPTGLTVIVDALLGTGTSGKPRETLARAIGMINQSGTPVISIDLPSGLDGDTGEAPGLCVRADMTVTFIGLKQGFRHPAAGQFCGRIVLDDLDIPTRIFRMADPGK